MSSTPIPDDLTSVLARLADQLGSLEARLARIEASAGHTIAATGPFVDSQEATKKPPFTGKPTKGKGRAQAPQAPSKATSAKKDRSTKKGAIPSSPVPLPLAQTFSTEGKTDRHLVTVVIPDASAQHVVGQGGKGLKQIHDISGARVRAYEAGSSDERHISIRGTDLQVGDALVVLGKRLARKKVRPPKAKKTGPSSDSSKHAPLPPNHLYTQQSLAPAAAPYTSTQRSRPATEPRIVEVSTEERDESPATAYAPTDAMASPSPNSTPTVPSVTMGSPNSYTPDDALTPMQIDAIHQRQARLTERLDTARSRGANTAQRGARLVPGRRRG